MNHYKATYLILLLGIFCISWSAVLVKLADVPALSSAFYRMFFALLCIIPLWWFNRKPVKDKIGILIAVVCGLLFAADIYYWNKSIVISKATISTLFANLSPIWVGLFAMIFLRKNLNIIFWIGTLIAFVGVIVLSGVSINDFTLNKGNLFAIISSLYYAVYLLLVKSGVEKTDTFTFTLVAIFAGVVLLAILGLFEGIPFVGFSALSWMYLFLLGLIPQVVGWLLINRALQNISATTGSVLMLLQAVFTAVVAYPLLNEVLTLVEIFGVLIVLIGISVVVLSRRINLGFVSFIDIVFSKLAK